MPKRFRTGLMCSGLVFAFQVSAQEIVINEIMYHPSSENVLEEYFELYNPATTNVNVGGWKISGGIDFVIPENTTISGRGYLVVAADEATFRDKYGNSIPMVGGWDGILSNSRNAIKLEDPTGRDVDSVTYADEGEWAIRDRGILDLGHRGWTWYRAHDGLGPSLELMNPSLPNEYGQNWGSSQLLEGTPGAENTLATSNIAPLIVDAKHFPVIPTTSDLIRVTARIVDESTANLTVRLYWRIDAASPPAFTVSEMFDDGNHADGAAGDGLYGYVFGALANNAIVEFYVEAVDGQGNSRTSPAAARQETGSFAQTANALFQVDNSLYTDKAPLFKLIMTAQEYQELGSIFSSAPNSDAQMNATFISLQGTDVEARYLCGVRNRGHGSRSGNPHNYRVNFRSDEPWNGKPAMNLNARNVQAQLVGAVLAQKAGVAGASSRPVRLLVNNGPGPGGTPGIGYYAANEDINSAWAESHFPNDGGGDAYKVVRDIRPPEFDYRGEDPDAYRNTYFKNTNESEDDWTGLIGMLRVMGLNGTVPFNEANVRQVIDLEQWMRHLALMAMFANNESGVFTGNNDDYFLYGGVKDPRYLMVYHDLDSILGMGSLGPTTDIFRPTCCPISGDSDGIWRAMNRFMHWPEFEPIYYATLQHMLDTTFSKEQFDPLVRQVLSDYAPGSINGIISWMDQRRAYVQSVINGLVPAQVGPAVIAGEPRSPTWATTATLQIGGDGITHYRYRLNKGTYGSETPVGTPIQLSNLANGSSNTVYVIGRNAAGVWQSTYFESVSRSWVVETSLPQIRLSEVLAWNVAAHDHSGTTPDVIELYNESDNAAIDLGGLRLSDDPRQPDKFTFSAGTMLEPQSYLAVYADDPNGTPGIHVGFSIDQDGEGVYLFDRVSDGGGLLDSVEFGHQLADQSIGRIGAGAAWYPCTPTVEGANVARSLAEPSNLLINEWLAAAQSPFPDDYLEIYNPNAQAVDLGGLYLTDEPIGARQRHKIRQSTFIPAGGYLVFIADGNTSKPGHLSFGLSSELGLLALIDAADRTIDCVAYGPQSAGVAMGRCPNAGSTIGPQMIPTPGTVNACPAEAVPPQLIPLISGTHVWKYEQTGTDLGADWREPNYIDDAWPSGPAILAIETCGCTPEVINTPLAWLNPQQITFYFRTTFNVEDPSNLDGLQLEHAVDDGAVFYLNGVEVYRQNMPSGNILYGTFAASMIGDANAYSAPVALPLELLHAGQNAMAVEVHNQNTSNKDIVFGMKLSGIMVTNSPSSSGLVINEVLASNATQFQADGSTPDLVELWNPSPNSVNLAGLGLSDSTANPHRWVFPAGTVLAGKSYLTVRFDPSLPPSATNTGFGLSATGDSLYLSDSVANGSAVLDSINFGLQAEDFSIGRVPDGSLNWALTLPSFGLANVEAPLGDAGLLSINEWMADPDGGDDWFELYNPNAHPVSVGGYYLTDDLSDVQKSMIPARSFIGAQTNAWRKFVADGNLGAGAHHVDFSLRATGEALGLFTPAGVQIDAISFGPQLLGVSEGRLPDGESDVVSFVDGPSPGERNFLALAKVVINEVLTHTDPPLEDAIELHNVTSLSVDVSGWWLSDSKSYPLKYQIPPGTVIPARGYHVFYEEKFNSSDFAAIPFSLSSAKGDQVILSAANAGVVNGLRREVDFGPSANGVSFGRFPTSIGVDFVSMSQRTFGVDTPADVNQFRGGTGKTNAYPLVGPVVITEIMYHPPGDGTNDNTRDEFIELHNLTGNTVPLYDPNYPNNTWHVRKGVDFDFPVGASIPPGGYILLVNFDPVNDPISLAGFEAVYGQNLVLYGPYGGKLDNGGEDIELRRPDTPQMIPGPDFGLVPYIVVERIQFSDQAPWPMGGDGDGQSLQRVNLSLYGNDPVNWAPGAPTPEPGESGMDDTDGDGMPDAWEMANGLNPNFNDADEDADEDGMTNLEEYKAGTDPQNPNSLLKVQIDGKTNQGAFLQFAAAPGKSYRVLYRDELASGVWNVLTNVPASGVPQQVFVTDPNAGNSSQRFYQLVTP